MNYIITSLCLLCMLSIIVYFAIHLIGKSRAEKLKFFKGFKKGKFALIYIAAIPLFWLGISYNGTSIGVAFFLAIRACVELVVLKYEYNSVSMLMNENVLYSIVMYMCYVLVAINAAVFTATLAGQKAYNHCLRRRITKRNTKVYVIVGYNKQTEDVINSISAKDGDVLLLTDGATDVADQCFIKKIAYSKIFENDIGKTLLRYISVFNNRCVNVIINTGNDATNLIYVEQISKIIADLDLGKYSIDDTRGLNGFVFGEPENASAFLHFVEKTNGCVHYVNKYKLIAMDFVEKYPITEFMTETHIDYDKATIKEGVDVNVVMIGFGKTNQQIFLTSVANNQLMTYKEELCTKPINYWVYDKKSAQNDKNLNHTYFRFRNELADDVSAYLPLPAEPANTKFFELGINDTRFYESVKKNLSPIKDANTSYNYIVIAFGTDMENLDFADKITAKLQEWELSSCTKVFVKIRDEQLSENVINVEYAPICGFNTFGNEKSVVYNLSQIVGERTETMARDRHLRYAITGGMDAAAETAAKEKALKKWYTQAQVQRESNVYACLSIRMKLQLLGYDRCSASAPSADAAADYYEKYENGDPIIYADGDAVKGRREVKYTNAFVRGSLRNALAVQEHQRWNAYMISCGFIPATRAQIESDGGKNMKTRRHGNLTTFDGLVEYRKIVAEKQERSEEETDVIRYDYQLMDDLAWLLAVHDYKIVKR